MNGTFIPKKLFTNLNWGSHFGFTRYLISPAHPAQLEWIGAGLTVLEIETWLYKFANVIIQI